MVSFYAFPVIFIDTLLFKKGTLIRCPDTLDTPWIRPCAGKCVSTYKLSRRGSGCVLDGVRRSVRTVVCAVRRHSGMNRSSRCAREIMDRTRASTSRPPAGAGCYGSRPARRSLGVNMASNCCLAARAWRAAMWCDAMLWMSFVVRVQLLQQPVPVVTVPPPPSGA